MGNGGKPAENENFPRVWELGCSDGEYILLGLGLWAGVGSRDSMAHFQ